MSIAVVERPKTEKQTQRKGRRTPEKHPLWLEASEYETDLRFLDGSKLQIERSPGGQLRMTIQGECCYVMVGVRRAFPLSPTAPELSFFHSESKEIGLLEDPDTLSPEARRLVDEELTKRYFQPSVLRIPSFKEEYGTMYWTMETDRGTRQVLVRNISESIRFLSEFRMLITDIHGNRCEIPNWSELDALSKKNLERIL